MPHQCNIEPKELVRESSRFLALTSKWLSLVVISAENVQCSLFFRSEVGIRAEKIKQLNSRHPYIIHPLSVFRKWYDFCILFIYIAMLIVKPIDSSIGRNQSIRDLFPHYREFSLSLDIISIVNIALQFGMGFTDAKQKLIEMDPSKIARNYLCSPFFIADVLSSIPRYLIYYFSNKKREWFIKIIIGHLNMFSLLKFVRILTVLQLIYKVSQNFHMKSGTIVFLLSATTAYLSVLHTASCLLIALPRLIEYNFGSILSGSPEFLRLNFKANYRDLYKRAVFRCSACILGTSFHLEHNNLVEIYALTVVLYIMGKIIMAITWIVLAMSILSNRTMDIKYYEVINQLNEYMRQKQLPLRLRQRILQLYAFKYQRIYFKEDMVNNLLSDQLRNDINVHLCRSLIENVSLFFDLSGAQVNKVVTTLIPEIFLPRDVIMQSGTIGDSMYFLSSGTVAVYTHSGKEVCHLQEGDYFGEVSLVLKGQARMATVIAVEITQVYKLTKRDFEKTLGKNRSVYEIMVRKAEIRLKETLQMEDRYKMELFEKAHTTTGQQLFAD